MFSKSLRIRVATLEAQIWSLQNQSAMELDSRNRLAALLMAQSALTSEVASLLRRLTIAHPVRIGRKGNKKPLNERIAAAKTTENEPPLFPVDSANGSGV